MGLQGLLNGLLNGLARVCLDCLRAVRGWRITHTLSFISLFIRSSVWVPQFSYVIVSTNLLRPVESQTKHLRNPAGNRASLPHGLSMIRKLLNLEWLDMEFYPNATCKKHEAKQEDGRALPTEPLRDTRFNCRN